MSNIYMEMAEEDLAYDYINEMARSKMDSDTFGIPSQKKYPMPDAKHVKLAIRFFNHVDKEHEKELARNIKKKIKQFNVTGIKASDKNRFFNYYKPVAEAVEEDSSSIFAFYEQDIEEVGILDAPKLINGFVKDIKAKRKAKKEEEKKRLDEIKKREEANKKIEQEKEEWKNLDSAERNKVFAYRKKKEAEFEKLINQELKKIYADKAFMAKIRKKIDKWFADGYLEADGDDKEYYNSNKVPKPEVENGGDYWVIINGSQYMRVVCHDICVKLAHNLEKITGYSIGTGDGDEGCIYPAELISDWMFYAYIYKKENK
jgi:unconventional prefoldin RPB5 interactor 1